MFGGGGARRVSGVLAAAGMLACLVGATASGQGVSLEPARFEPGPCPTKQVDPNVAEVLSGARCGVLIVPENRTVSGGRTIRNSVAIVPAASPTPAPDPIVYVHGGPGSSAILEAGELVAVANMNRDRDLILMSQRGNLHSEPDLTCRAVDRFNARAVSLGLDSPKTKRLRRQATRTCRRDALEQGADLAAYNTTESAADLEDLRTTLGIPVWNVVGHSYGTQLTQTYMRIYPAAIRAVVLDGVVPADQASYGLLWRAVGEGFHALVRACNAQRACRRAHPKLGRTFNRLVREAASDPVTTRVKTDAGKRVKVVLDASTLVSWLVVASHLSSGAPAALDALADGRPRPLAEQWALPRLNPAGFEHFSWGLLNSATCAEWSEGRREEVGEGRRAFPRFPSSVWPRVPQVPFHRSDCRIWGVPKASPTLRQPTVSDIPTLILNGSFDAQTAASNGAHVAGSLSNSTNVIIRGAAHGTFFASPCAAGLITSFFDDPAALDTTCVADVKPPKFSVG